MPATSMILKRVVASTAVITSGAYAISRTNTWKQRVVPAMGRAAQQWRHASFDAKGQPIRYKTTKRVVSIV